MCLFYIYKIWYIWYIKYDIYIRINSSDPYPNMAPCISSKILTQNILIKIMEICPALQYCKKGMVSKQYFNSPQVIQIHTKI